MKFSNVLLLGLAGAVLIIVAKKLVAAENEVGEDDSFLFDGFFGWV